MNILHINCCPRGPASERYRLPVWIDHVARVRRTFNVGAQGPDAVQQARSRAEQAIGAYFGAAVTESAAGF